ncbi:mitochondrial carrier protein [Nitzschia inconspicua]|uniref:Mitochondrial carrier protein n=1 Tax=Nitzschia inconspicua TaxID=303405 RepID=A0A9K3LCQ9_9STRA|nr:mitochondrial carrier protein [Nitzschia inconspicua]KAG7358306.1 mitochondrial carrier protein [Nitzschia inconspicua]
MTSFSEAWVDFIAGWAGGAAAVILCQPMDTVLTRLQAGTSAAAKLATSSAPRSSITSSSSALAAQSITRNMISSSGVTSLWRGASPMISAVPFQNSLLMGGYGIGKQWAEANEEVTSATSHDGTSTNNNNRLLPVFVGGCTGGVVQSFLMSPVEWVKVQTQVVAGAGGSEARATAWHATQQLLRPSIMTCGLTATLLRDGIPHGVWFVSYEWCKNVLDAKNVTSDDDNNNAMAVASETHRQLTIPLVSGAFAATMAWGVGYPFDIIKTRIQATSSHKSVYATAMELVQEANGSVVRGLYRGFGLKLVRSVPASMITFTTYEWVAGQLRT